MEVGSDAQKRETEHRIHTITKSSKKSSFLTYVPFSSSQKEPSGYMLGWYSSKKGSTVQYSFGGKMGKWWRKEGPFLDVLRKEKKMENARHNAGLKVHISKTSCRSNFGKWWWL